MAAISQFYEKTAMHPQENILDIGYLIGQTRQQMGLSVEEVATAIRLRNAHIRAIEDGALAQLPGEPYTRSYIKRYVEFLELDSERLLAAYDAAVAPEPRKLFVLPEIFSYNTHASGPLALVCVILALAVVLAWNWAHPSVNVPLVMRPEPVVVSEAMLPHRCTVVRESYPPCRFENIALWYNPITPNFHLFAPHHDPAP